MINVKVDINSQVTVFLTKMGLRIFEEKQISLIYTNHHEYHLQGYTLRTQLYTLMALFGEYYTNNAVEVFDGGVIHVRVKE